jgi:hypothetical protein
MKDNVELSTFTPDDDIILKLKDRLLAFDKHGNQLEVQIDKDVVGIFEEMKLN